MGSSAAWTGVSGGEGAICLLISLLISSIGLVKAMRTSSSLLCKNKVHSCKQIINVTVRGLGDLALTSQYRSQRVEPIVKSPRTQKSGLAKKREEKTASYGFQRGDWVSTPGFWRTSNRRHSPCQPQPVKHLPSIFAHQPPTPVHNR